MSAPETEAPPAPPPPPAGPPGAPPPPSADLAAIDLLSQAFNTAGEQGNVLLAGNIGGGLSRLTVLVRAKAVLEQDLAAANAKWQALTSREAGHAAEVEQLKGLLADETGKRLIAEGLLADLRNVPAEPEVTPVPIETPFLPPPPDAVAVPAAEGPPGA
jgi:hypothetical protein